VHPAVALVSLGDAADDVKLLFGTIEERLRFAELVSGHDDDESDTHVEGAKHLVLGNVAERSKVFEDWQHRPGTKLDLSGSAARQDARQVFGDAAASDVSHTRREPRIHELLNDGQVAAVDFHQSRSGFLLNGAHILCWLVLRYFEKELACERVAIGMEPG